VVGWYADAIKPPSEFLESMNRLSSVQQFNDLIQELRHGKFAAAN